eukprot:CAMPEP_0198293958 /NCGR_PEP_ID=MMETSP1449-20131203/19730_1 /TAXON_ID=420275 /ORGANISM="Attheya septentrionalis, Strain CCMP2084" /LENGTH=393 /DNA_ID=CAMNT_0043993729 /DNA_START=88 /DNA_END=1266 /DNA_ORIENTATION=-
MNIKKSIRSDERRGYSLLLVSSLYLFAYLLDRALLVPQWKYRNAKNASASASASASATATATAETGNSLKYSKLSTAINQNGPKQDCQSLLHNDYKDAHIVITTRGDGKTAPPPHTTVFALTPSQSIISKHLISKGIWEPGLYRKLKQKLRPGMVFLDVGANIGLFSIYAQSIGAQVIAVEAMDTNAQFITASECMNSVTHGAHAGSIYLFHYAAHPAPDDADCSIRGATLNRDNGELWCRDKKDGNNAGQSSEKQQLARLDSMVQEIRTHGQLPFEQIDLMKIDVEGFEQAVMESASGMSYPPKGIVFECNAKQSKARNHNTLFWRRYLMDNHGYCNGFTYATGEDPFILQLIFPYFPFIDAIALGTCGGGNFYLDCSGFMGEGVLLFSYRW